MKFKLKVAGVPVNTNLETTLKSRTTKEEAAKEVERMCKGKVLLEEYVWRIEGNPHGGVNDFGADLQNQILERIGEEEPDESVFWDGTRAVYELNVYQVSVNTNLEVALKSETSKEDAVREVESMCREKNLFDGYDWKTEGRSEGGINEFSADLQNDIIERIGQGEKIGDLIEEIL